MRVNQLNGKRKDALIIRIVSHHNLFGLWVDDKHFPNSNSNSLCPPSVVSFVCLFSECTSCSPIGLVLIWFLILGFVLCDAFYIVFRGPTGSRIANKLMPNGSRPNVFHVANCERRTAATSDEQRPKPHTRRWRSQVQIQPTNHPRIFPFSLISDAAAAADQRESELFSLSVRSSVHALSCFGHVLALTISHIMLAETMAP